MPASTFTTTYTFLTRKKNVLVFILYIIIFFILLLPTINGVGQYWDWSFPYFKEQVPNYFLNFSASWVPQNFGMPMGYSSDFFFRFTVYILSFLKLNPETLLFLINLSIFTIGSFGVYLICKRKNSFMLSVLIGIVSFINTTIFYKFIAGHTNYLVSYVVFIYFVYYLLFSYKNTIRSSIIVGLIFAFVGVQLQFFVITGIFFLVYFFLNKEKFQLRNLVIIGSIPILVNSLWLSNYFFSINSISHTINVGILGGFKSISEAGYFNIFSLSFAEATLITRFFSKIQLLYLSLISLIFFIYLLSTGKKNKDILTMLIFLLALIYLATGNLRSLPIATISNLMASLFREVGHFAPLIFLSILLVICFTAGKKSILNFIFCTYLVFFCFVVGVTYQKSYSLVNYGSMRQKLEPFVHIDKSDQSTYRILSYPFWGQYGIKDVEQRKTEDGFLLSNAGWDSFGLFSGKENVSIPAIPKGSLQYDLLQNYNINKLKVYNVKYVYDLSSIYESFMNKYISSSMYGNDLNVIKNDPDFLFKLMTHNPGVFDKISDHVLRVRDVTPRVFSIDSIFFTPADNVSYATEHFTTSVFGKDFYFTSDTSALSDIGATPFNYLFSPFKDASKVAFKNHQLVYQDPFLDKVSRIVNMLYTNHVDQAVLLNINNVPLAAPINEKDSNETKNSAIENLPIDVYTPLPITLQKDANVFSYDEPRENQKNVIQNPSFEDGLWHDKVLDCFNYDSNSQIGIRINNRASTDGKNSLQLEAAKHVACTLTTVPLKSNSQYLLSFDYQSEIVGSYMGFAIYKEGTYVSLGDSKTQVFDTDWHSYSQIVKVPADVTQAEFYLYSYFSDKITNNIIRYDNFKLIPIPNIIHDTFLYGGSDIELRKPQSVIFEIINPARKNIDVIGATLPFFLAMSDSYHPAWFLEPRNEKNTGFLNSRFPLSSPDKLDPKYHYSLNNALNMWYIEPEKFCQEFSVSCQKNSDGSYTIHLVADFWPQRWFNLGLVISGLTVSSSVLIIFFRRKKDLLEIISTEAI